MPTTYAQKQATAQKKNANTAASVVDCSSQGEALQRKAALLSNSCCNVIQCAFNLQALQEENSQAVTAFINDEGTFACRVGNTTIVHVSAGKFDYSKKGRKNNKKAKNSDFTTIFYAQGTDRIYAIGVHQTGNSYYIQEIDDTILGNPFKKGKTFVLG